MGLEPGDVELVHTFHGGLKIHRARSLGRALLRYFSLPGGGADVRKVWIATLIGALFGGVLVAGSASPTIAAAAPPAPIATPSAPVTGERFLVAGQLSTRIVRPVQLQVKSGKKWKKLASGKTDKAGDYSLRASTKATSITVRVVAPKVKVKGKKYKALTTKARAIRTVKSQTAMLSMPGTAQVTEAVNAMLSFTPARAGRPVRLEALVSDTWTPVGAGVETAEGNALIQLTATTVGTFSYRGTASAWNGAPAVSSMVRQLNITPSRITLLDTTRPLSDKETAAITSYAPDSGTVVFTNAPASLGSVDVGDVIAVPPRNGAPSGALRKVTKLTTSASTTTIDTQDTSLAQAVENIPDDETSIGLAVTTSSFEPADGVTVDSEPVVSQAIHGTGLRPASTGELKLTLDAKTQTKDGLFMKLKGGLSIAPVHTLDLNVDWFRLKSYKIGAGVQISNSTVAEVGITGTGSLFSAQQQLGVLHQGLIGHLLGLPVYLDITLNLVATVDVTGTVSVTAEVSQTGTTGSGVQSTRDWDLTPAFYTTSANTTSKLIKVGAAGSIDAFLGPELDIMVYSAGGLYGKLGARTQAELAFNTTDGWKCALKYGPHAEIGLKTSDIIKKLTGVEAKASAKVDFTSIEVPLCPSDVGGTGGGGNDLSIATTSLPEATKGATYTATLSASGGSPPYTWTATGLPDGLTVSAGGELTGAPTAGGAFTPIVTLADSAGTTLTRTYDLTVHPVDEPYRVAALTGESWNSCALLAVGTVKCWGHNAFGQLGDGTTTSESTAVQVSGLTDATAITGGTHVCAITREGLARCWGYNAYGQLGDGTKTDRSTPTTVPALTDVTAIAAGHFHTCAVASGAVECWGDNTLGQLGDGTTDSSSTPVTVPGLSNVVQLTAGAYFTCAREGDGTVKCWGEGDLGQLGDGTTDPWGTARTVRGLDDAISISAGGYHVCALTAASTVKCWGYNQLGELGDGTTVNRAEPVVVAGVTDADGVVAGGVHTCAWTRTGNAECWGADQYGQLGDGNLTTRPTPARVVSLDGVTKMASGNLHTCALSSGLVKCWGYNVAGQLGDGSTTDRNIPVQAIGLR